MFYSITGKVILTESGTIVIETGGIGYRLTVSGKTLGYTAEKAEMENVSLFTYLSVREDALELFGFYSKSELDMFKRLISVSGVGPKAAISILTQMSPAELGTAVVSGDYKPLTRAPGIGRKIAERILLELKDKIAREALSPAENHDNLYAGANITDPDKLSDAENTLLVLGYSRTEIADSLHGIDMRSLSLEEVIKAALKKLMK